MELEVVRGIEVIFIDVGEDLLAPSTFLVPKRLVLASKEAGVEPTGTRPSNWSGHF